MPEETAPDETAPAETPAEEADWLKELRKEAKEAKTLRAEVAGLKRQSAMDEIGIAKTGAGKLFRDSWTGDPTDLDALRSAAREYELIPDEGATPEAAAEAAQAATRAAEVTDGAGTPQLTVDALLADAQTPEEVERIMQDAGLGVAPS